MGRRQFFSCESENVMYLKKQISSIVIFISLIILLAACGAAVPPKPSAAGKLNVVATTTIIGDIAHNVGGDQINLTVLPPVGADPHDFVPSPRDVVAVSDADVVLVNGFGLEQFLGDLVRRAADSAAIVEVSSGVEPMALQLKEDDQAETNGAQPKTDPHTWTSPANAIIFVRNIEQALRAADPTHAQTYQANAQAYITQLEDLDTWVKNQIETIPPENRKLVSDHAVFGYYAQRYGLTQVGAVIPAFSSSAQPSAREMADLQAAIHQYQVRAIFVGTTTNKTLAEQIAHDTGVKLVPLFTGSLGAAGSGADTYLDYIRYNTTAIVEALR